LTYFWLPQRRGFVRNSLTAGRCDVVIGVPARYELLLTTGRYYRSSYAFVSRRDRHLAIDSFDAPPLKTLTIGIQISGDDYNNPPAAQELAARHIIQNVRGFTIYGDYSQPDPQRDIIDAVVDGRVDVAVVWGPLAGYYAQRAATRLDVTPIVADEAGPSKFAFDIAMGVRRNDVALRDALDAIIARRDGEIRHILRSYGVPLR
jgi:quinoprotein dehydrogenase-associated probable ABC transporter substrate-binding protein